MTSVAWSSTYWGMASPSAWAVLRLTAKPRFSHQGDTAVTASRTSRRAALIRAAQDAAAQYSLPTRCVLETLVREVSCDNAERVLELARRVDDEATTAVYQSLTQEA
jgi:hypothetical protein